MRVIHLVRKPLSEGSVVANAQRWETGGINIDACRVGYAVGESAKDLKRVDGLDPSPRMGGCYAQDKYSKTMLKRTNEEGNPNGRWPANLILEHLPGCMLVGTKTVKGSPSSTTLHEAYAGESVTGILRGISSPQNQHGDSKGNETVSDWQCVFGCPVAELSAQSGLTRTAGNKNESWQPIGYHGAEGRKAMTINYQDVGTASRYFKQVQSKDGD